MQLDKSNGESREPSEVVSRYLEAIYYMWFEKEPLRSARLADWLGVSRPTVAVGLRRMTRDGLVRMNGRKEIELTEAGQRAAEAITRVCEVAEREAPPLLEYLHKRELTPGREVSIAETDEVGKTVRVSVGGRDVTLSHETASKVWVVPAAGRR